MIRDLLKQLLMALGQFAKYHIRRILRLPYHPPTALTSPLVKRPAEGSIATEASIARLSDSVRLDPAYKKLVQWPCYQADLPPQEVASNALFKEWAALPGGHKWTHYFPVYEAVFRQIRANPLSILEIGILYGSSLKLWRQYFKHPKTVIVGIDVLEDCIKFDSPATGIHIRIGSQADPVFLKQLVQEFGPFDLIIDDGSHHSSHIISSFNHLYADGLKDNGILLCRRSPRGLLAPLARLQEKLSRCVQRVIGGYARPLQKLDPVRFFFRSAFRPSNFSLGSP
jgi:hypothetical protein